MLSGSHSPGPARGSKLGDSALSASHRGLRSPPRWRLRATLRERSFPPFPPPRCRCRPPPPTIVCTPEKNEVCRRCRHTRVSFLVTTKRGEKWHLSFCSTQPGLTSKKTKTSVDGEALTRMDSAWFDSHRETFKNDIFYFSRSFNGTRHPLGRKKNPRSSTLSQVKEKAADTISLT